MGSVYADIELINADDVAFAKINVIGSEEIKKISFAARAGREPRASQLCCFKNEMIYCC